MRLFFEEWLLFFLLKLFLIFWEVMLLNNPVHFYFFKHIKIVIPSNRRSIGKQIDIKIERHWTTEGKKEGNKITKTE